MTDPNDPYRTRPLPPLTQALARPVALPLGAIAALLAAPALLMAAGLALWLLARPGPPPPAPLLPSPTLGLPRALAGPGVAPGGGGLPRAVVAYDAPGGRALGALEPGRPYRVVARSGAGWVQLDVGRPGAANVVWVRAEDVPEVVVAVTLADLATPAPTPTAQVVVVAPAPPPAAPAPVAAPAPAPTAAPLVALPAPTPRPVVLLPYPTATPCSIRDLGLGLVPCTGYTR